MAFEKSFTDNLNILVVLVLVSIDCPFFIQFDIFQVLGMSGDFQFEPRHFPKIWILFKAFVLTGFLDTTMAGEVEHCASLCQVEVEVLLGQRYSSRSGDYWAEMVVQLTMWLHYC